MADDWDLSDEDAPPATTTTTTIQNNTTAKPTTATTTTTTKTPPQQPKKKKKRKRRKKKQDNDNKTSQNSSERQSPFNAQKNKKKKEDTWSDSDDDKEIPQTKSRRKKKKQTPSLATQDSSAGQKRKKHKKTKTNKDLDDASNDEAEERRGDDDDATDKKGTGMYPIWRPEQNSKYDGLQYTAWPNYIQREEILLKVKRKQTFVDVLHAFERTHGMNSTAFDELSVDLLEVYGLNIWNKFVPIYELIGEDNHRPFMIELDSLLLDIFHCPLIQNNLKFGARLGALMHLLETHLDLYFGGGRSVQIVMFSNHCNLWKYPVHYFMREFVKYYLRVFWQRKQQTKYDISYPLVFEFESFWSVHFSNYIYEYLPVFACVARPDLSPFICDENRYLFIYLTFYIISLNTPCVQSTEITFASNALYGFTIDVPSDIKRYLLDRFITNKGAGSANPVELKALVAPKPPRYLAEMPTFNKNVFTNLNFIEWIANDAADDSKRNLRRLATVYSLISMFRRDVNSNSKLKFDFIKLILLHVIILEHNPNEYRSQMLPKLIERKKSTMAAAAAAANNKAKAAAQSASSWLDLDDDESDPEEEDETKEEEEEEEEEIEEKTEEKTTNDDEVTTTECDLESIMNECWWIQMDKFGDLLDEFMLHCTVCLSQYSSNANANESEFDGESFADCFDFRIVCYLLTIASRLKSMNALKGCLGAAITDTQLNEFDKLFALVMDEVNLTKSDLFPIIGSDYLLSSEYSSSECYDYNRGIVLSPNACAKNAFIRVDGSTIVDSLCGDLEVSLNKKGLLYSTKASKISGARERSDFFRKYEWIRGGQIPDGIKPYVYEHRNYMIFQTFIAKYAQSLEGGKVVLRDVIVAKKDESVAKEKKYEKRGHKKQRKYKHKHKKEKINVRLAAELEVRAKERRIKLEKISNLIRICDTHYASLEQRIARLDEELCLMDASDGEAALPGLMKLHEWATQAALQCNPERNMFPVVRLWQITFDIFRRYIENMDAGTCIVSLQLIRNLQSSLHLLGFFECARRIASVFADKWRGKYSIGECVVPQDNKINNIRISIGCSYQRFQLQYCGAYMIRGVGSRPDARVSGFYPDEWQIKLLDIVDAGESALVVAPTSCGKTFVSYYCMKEILQQNKSIKSQSQKGLVVYVSPTKALTWQACADIYSKYGDVFGVLTPDYDHKPLECQVLVCVPESFEKLLMSRERQQFAQQIRYVIFDEIHCLGRSEGGAIWERLLMLISSPFLALSATVGAPHKLAEWLNRIKNERVHLIQHKERWSYLEKYIYLPTSHAQSIANMSDGSLHVGCYRDIMGWKSSITSMHPVGAIGLMKQIGANLLDVYHGFPPFLTFSPTDSVTFYDAMYRYVPNNHLKERLIALKPDAFFASKIYITKNDASAYEKLLKEELNLWLRDGHKAIVNELLNSMASDALQRIDEMEAIYSNCYSSQWVQQNFIHLVLELSSTDRLPALVFVLDRVECEELYLKLLHDLQYLEEKKKERELLEEEAAMGGANSKERREKLRALEIEKRRRAKKLEKERKKREKQRETNARQKKDEGEGAPGDEEDAELADEERDKRDFRFSLFDRGDEMDSDEMRFWIRRLMKKTKWAVTHPLLIGLERGIGLHHEGLPLQYRHLVETLFRARHIKLVVSVASLAMGVNMPARSVIFAGDDASLDPLNYRQMMGRAGRRGYDNIGHVIFCGISPRKISYLMTSQLTSLNGHFPILSTTSSMRCNRIQSNLSIVRNLFNQPFNYCGAKRNESFFFRYCLEYHIQNGLLSPHKLSPDGLGELASVLYEYEPNNLLFVHLLQTKEFHKLCAGYHKLPGDHTSKLKKDILQKLMLILCFIFELHPHPVSYKPPSHTKYLSKSHLILPLIKNSECDIRDAINKYRYNFISHYYNMYYLHQPQTQNVIYGKENIINSIEYYLKYCGGGIFGHNQIFSSDFRGRNLANNSYIYDFYLHEDYRRIVDESSLRDGLAWRKLKRFQLLLSMINKSLNHISSLKSKQDQINQDVKEKIAAFENSLQKLKQHKFSVYRRQQQFWMDQDGKLWKKHEIQLEKDRMKLQAIGDDFVMAFQDLYKDFNSKFRNIVPIGPISNYSQIIAKKEYDLQQQQQAAAANNTTTTTANNDSLKKK